MSIYRTGVNFWDNEKLISLTQEASTYLDRQNVHLKGVSFVCLKDNWNEMDHCLKRKHTRSRFAGYVSLLIIQEATNLSF